MSRTTQTDQYLSDFFDEKEIPYTAFEVDGPSGPNYMDTDVVIEAIKSAPHDEKKQIADKLRYLDFHNAPIVPFLKHLGQALAM